MSHDVIVVHSVIVDWIATSSIDFGGAVANSGILDMAVDVAANVEQHCQN